MKPLRITATFRSPVALDVPRWVALDALLAAVEAKRLGLPPVSVGGPEEVPIHVQQHAAGFSMASFGVAEIAAVDLVHLRRRFDRRSGAILGRENSRKVNIATGPYKQWNKPLRPVTVARAVWTAVGDQAWIEDTLTHVSSVGKRRNSGNGEVGRWTVEETERFALWHPVQDGVLRPVRTVPMDLAPREVDAEIPTIVARLTPPYWYHSGHQVLAAPPEWGETCIS